MKRKPTRPWLPAAAVGFPVALAAAVFAIPGLIDNWVKSSRSGPPHAFEVSPPPPFLTDELALEKAAVSLALDGYDPSAWQPSPDNRTRAPDGLGDQYLVRNTLNANQGFIVFRTAERANPNPTRVVTVELKNGRVECVVVTPK